MYQNGRSVCHTHFWTIKSTIWVVLQNIRKKQCFPSTICVYWFLFGKHCVLGDFCLHNLTLPSSCLQRATINLISSDQHPWHHVIANSKQVARKWNGHWVMCLLWAATSYAHPRHSGEVRSRISRRKDLQSASFNDWIATNQPLSGSDFDSISIEKNESLFRLLWSYIHPKNTSARE